jgi:hypothetical protein
MVVVKSGVLEVEVAAANQQLVRSATPCIPLRYVYAYVVSEDVRAIQGAPVAIRVLSKQTRYLRFEISPPFGSVERRTRNRRCKP